MVLSDEKLREYSRRILLARMRILTENGFFGLLLMHMKIALGEECECAYTDYKSIFFNPAFLDRINDDELVVMLKHEIMHVVLKHGSRLTRLAPERANIAADIVVNSNILRAAGGDLKSITVFGEVMPHLAPNGKEGADFSVEELYRLIPEPNGSPVKGPGSLAKGGGGGAGKPKKSGKEDPGKAGKADQSIKGGKTGGEDREDRNEGKARFLPRAANDPGLDSHLKPDENEEDDEAARDEREEWQRRIKTAAEAVRIREKSRSRGLIPAFAQRLLEDLTRPQTDWRTILNDFVQEEICDYSFNPPDRRFQDSPFLLPDYNDTDVTAKDLLFMIDTSGSMSDKMIRQAYSEVYGAIEQFNGKIAGWLGFFDAVAVEPKEFSDEESFRIIRPVGGGGTSFACIFQYVKEHRDVIDPVGIIILTDGYAPFPDKKETMEIPVLWIINNEEVTPPWGKIARIREEKEDY